MSTTSASPVELQNLSAGLQRWGDAVDFQRSRLGGFSKTMTDAQTMRTLAVRTNEMAHGLDDTARSFLAADSPSPREKREPHVQVMTAFAHKKAKQ